MRQQEQILSAVIGSNTLLFTFCRLKTSMQETNHSAVPVQHPFLYLTARKTLQMSANGWSRKNSSPSESPSSLLFAPLEYIAPNVVNSLYRVGHIKWLSQCDIVGFQIILYSDVILPVKYQ